MRHPSVTIASASPQYRPRPKKERARGVLLRRKTEGSFSGSANMHSGLSCLVYQPQMAESLLNEASSPSTSTVLSNELGTSPFTPPVRNAKNLRLSSSRRVALRENLSPLFLRTRNLEDEEDDSPPPSAERRRIAASSRLTRNDDSGQLHSGQKSTFSQLVETRRSVMEEAAQSLDTVAIALELPGDLDFKSIVAKMFATPKKAEKISNDECEKRRLQHEERLKEKKEKDVQQLSKEKVFLLREVERVKNGRKEKWWEE